MTESRAFDLKATWPEGSRIGEEDVADIVIRANGEVLTRLVDVVNDETRDFIRAPAVTLALWFADKWWRLRFEPYPQTLVPPSDWRRCHELTAVSGGIRWPPLMFYGTGERVVVAPRAGIADVPGPVRYLNLVVASIDGESYENQLDGFFDTIIDRCASATDGHALSIVLSDLRREREYPGTAAWRRLEAQLGYDVDAAPDELMEQFALLREQIGEVAVTEAAMSAPGQRSAAFLREALLAAEESEVEIDRRVAREFELVNRRPAAIMSAWQLAEGVASELRSHIGIRRGPIRGAAFADILCQQWEVLKDARATARHLPYAAVASRTGDRERFAMKSDRSAAHRRFELARALGDAAWDANAGFAPVSDAKTDRQKFQRAFAQSFLCPFDDLLEFMDTRTPGPSDILAAARHFHVTEGVVRTVLVNKHVLPRETLEDRLEVA